MLSSSPSAGKYRCSFFQCNLRIISFIIWEFCVNWSEPRKFRNRGFLNQSFKSTPVFNEANVSNYCSHGALRSESFDESVNYEEFNDLKSRIFQLRLPKRSAIRVLERWTSEGNQVTIAELRNISKELRKIQRYKHALEVLFYLFYFCFLQVSVFGW